MELDAETIHVVVVGVLTFLFGGAAGGGVIWKWLQLQMPPVRSSPSANGTVQVDLARLQMQIKALERNDRVLMGQVSGLVESMERRTSEIHLRIDEMTKEFERFAGYVEGTMGRKDNEERRRKTTE